MNTRDEQLVNLAVDRLMEKLAEKPDLVGQARRAAQESDAAYRHSHRNYKDGLATDRERKRSDSFYAVSRRTAEDARDRARLAGTPLRRDPGDRYSGQEQMDAGTRQRLPGAPPMYPWKAK